jgi:transposase-like protein
MGLKRTNEFRKDAVRIALTSGQTRKHVADDLGVGMSTLNKWITAHGDTDVVSNEDLGLVMPPFLTGCVRRIYAAIFSFFAGVGVPPSGGPV